MARPNRQALPPPPPAGGGYEFEVVQLGPPTYFSPPPANPTRGGLIPAGDGEGLIARPAPPARSSKRWLSRLPLRTFTARVREPDSARVTTVAIRGHELRYTRKRHETHDAAVVEVLVHLPTGPISVAVFNAETLLGLYEGQVSTPDEA